VQEAVGSRRRVAQRAREWGCGREGGVHACACVCGLATLRAAHSQLIAGSKLTVMWSFVMAAISSTCFFTSAMSASRAAGSCA
jgi:hypothetical protein